MLTASAGPLCGGLRAKDLDICEITEGEQSLGVKESETAFATTVRS
jgi:hypothetical protein